MTFRNIQNIDKRIERIKFRKEPVVLVPLKDWNKIGEFMEESEMLTSKKFRSEVERARKEKKLYSSTQIKKILHL